MTMMKNKFYTTCLAFGLLLSCSSFLSAQTITEKKAGMVKGTGGDLDRDLQKQLQYVNQ